MVLQAGYSAGILSPAVFLALVMMALVVMALATTAMTGPLLRYQETTRVRRE